MEIVQLERILGSCGRLSRQPAASLLHRSLLAKCQDWGGCQLEHADGTSRHRACYPRGNLRPSSKCLVGRMGSTQPSDFQDDACLSIMQVLVSLDIQPCRRYQTGPLSTSPNAVFQQCNPAIQPPYSQTSRPTSDGPAFDLQAPY